MNEDIHFLGAVEAGAAVKAGRLSSEQLTRHLLERVERLDPTLGSYVHVSAEAACEQAAQADRELREGLWRGPLHGVPLALKDLVFTRDAPTASGMDLLRDWRPDFDATVVARLRAAGAVILGKLKMTEGATGGYHPTVTPPLNPWQHDYWTGHSSSGCGVATAAGLCFASLGSDTGGSIRYPASANSLYGLKPTWGRVSRHGIFPMSPALDHVGPLTRCVADMAAVMDVISGWDANDPTSRPGAASAYLEHLSPAPAGIRIGLDRAALQGVAPEIRAALDAAADALQHAGCRIVDVTLPDLARAAAAWLPLCAPAMAVAHAEYFQNESARYGPVLRALVELGMQVPGTDVIRADLERRNFSGGVDALLGSVDLLLLPVQPMAPPTTESMRNRPKDPSASQRALLFTAPFNLSGHPSLSIPSTFTAAGAPVGVQLIARRNGEQLLLDVAAAYERHHPPEHRHPPALTGALHR